MILHWNLCHKLQSNYELDLSFMLQDIPGVEQHGGGEWLNGSIESLDRAGKPATGEQEVQVNLGPDSTEMANMYSKSCMDKVMMLGSHITLTVGVNQCSIMWQLTLCCVLCTFI
jgi:hypothetical protein